jgi:hypothetical protein
MLKPGSMRCNVTKLAVLGNLAVLGFRRIAKNATWKEKKSALARSMD